jgi:hypothetical protein
VIVIRECFRIERKVRERERESSYVENKIFNFGKILLHERESYAKPIINVVERIYQGLAR